RYLAAPKGRWRLRGTEGNARARAQIVASLEAAGLAPLFSDSFGRAPWLLRRALAADRRRVEKLLQSWDQGVSPTPKSYLALQLASIRIQAALWHPSAWWFALWYSYVDCLASVRPPQFFLLASIVRPRYHVHRRP